MNIRSVVMILGFSILSFPSLSQASTDVTITGEGAGLRTCAYFQEEYKKGPPQVEYLYFSWAQGYMSGLNATRGIDDKQGFKSVPMAEQRDRIQKYCDAHPEKRYVDSVLELYLTLYPKHE